MPLPSGTTRNAALALLHNHEAMTTMHPLNVSFRELVPAASPSSSSPSSEQAKPLSAYPPRPSPSAVLYEIVEDITRNAELVERPAWKSMILPNTVTFLAWMESKPDGLRSEVHVPGGLKVVSEWSLESEGVGAEVEGQVGEERLILREISVISGNRFVVNIAKPSQHESHTRLAKRFVEKLLESGA